MGDPTNPEKSGTPMAKKPKSTFDPKAFLSKIGKGRSIANYPPSQSIFSQGDLADSVFYIEEGKVKLTVISELGKDRHHPFSCGFFHEQVSEIGLYRL
jgi:hypothetical protein